MQRESQLDSHEHGDWFTPPRYGTETKQPRRPDGLYGIRGSGLKAQGSPQKESQPVAAKYMELAARLVALINSLSPEAYALSREP
jgi:hypothetical protein